MNNIKTLLIPALSLAAVLAVGFAALQFGWLDGFAWYRSTELYKKRATRDLLHSLAESYEAMNMVPRADHLQIIDEQSGFWGTPIQYSYEDGKPVIRAAGKDRELFTEDDLTQKVRISDG